MNCGGQGDNTGGSEHNQSGNSGNSSSGERSDESEDGGDNGVAKKRQTRRKHKEVPVKPQTSGKLALNLSASVTSFSASTSSSASSSTSSSQIRRYGMGTEGSDSPSSALKLPRTLSTSVLKVKYRSSFWEKFWEERSKRDM